MPPALDIEHRLLGDMRQAPAALGSAFGLSGGDIDAGEGRSSCGDGEARGESCFDQLFEMRILGGERVPACLGYAAGLLVQRHSIEAHRAGHGLAMAERLLVRH